MYTLRIRLISIALTAATILVLGRLYYIQVVHGDEFAERAATRYRVVAAEDFDRGTIYFTDKEGAEVAVGTLQEGFILAITPIDITDPEETYEKLARLLPLSRDEFLTKAGKRDDPYEEIKRQVPVEIGEQIEKLRLPGVSVYREKWRVYPGEQLASHILGFLAYKENKRAGRYGLERYYEDVLYREGRGAPSNFFAELFGGFEKVASREKKFEGDIVASLEPTVQGFLERELELLGRTYRMREGGAVVIAPESGEVIGMAVHPSFDPNAFQKEKDSGVFGNPFVESVYEFGSIMKPLTMAIGIDTGTVTATSTYRDDGFMELNGKRISNFDGKARGVVNMQEVLSQSLNTGAAHVALSVGKERFVGYLEELGFGEETGIDLPNETHGLIGNLQSGRDIEQATASFGQGIALTPIGAARALATLANGGLLPDPHIVSRITYRLGFSKEIRSDPPRRVFSERTAETVTGMLVRVVDTALLGGSYKVPHYSIAAKTGTAEIAKEGGGGYYDDRYLHSFFGYAPAYDPKFFVFFYLLEPQGVTYASHTLTEPFMKTMKFLLNYYEVPPDR
ncbi:MAG: cell division protein FtsI (penicillin-binding protein 3) [Parcubacteria group bacterium Gr01-1014_72]|nr:MAG: cell division protein FtsI (penicillin-binding protein 3) [Parcubacteria group bacterium Gr01-1014_72]